MKKTKEEGEWGDFRDCDLTRQRPPKGGAADLIAPRIPPGLPAGLGANFSSLGSCFSKKSVENEPPEVFGWILGVLGGNWANFWSLGGHLGLFFDILRYFLGSWGAFGLIFGALGGTWAHFSIFWGNFWGLGGHLGSFLEPWGSLLGPLGSLLRPWGPLGGPWGAFWGPKSKKSMSGMTIGEPLWGPRVIFDENPAVVLLAFFGHFSPKSRPRRVRRSSTGGILAQTGPWGDIGGIQTINPRTYTEDLTCPGP